MPFIAPAIVAAAGITGAAAVAAEIAIGVGASLALGAASRALAPSPKTASAAGMRLSLRTTDNSPRAWSVGRLADAGELKYHHVHGPNGNDTLQLVIQLADHECDGLETIYVDGVAIEWNSSTGAVTEYPGMTVTWHGGAPGQTADANLVAASGGRWTSDDVGTGIAYVVVKMAYAAKTYPNGLPKFLFVFRGAKVYDIRKDTTAGGSGSHRWGTPSTYEWSDNVAVIAYNYLRGVSSAGQRLTGMHAPAASLPAADWIAAANVCDEAVTLSAGGNEKRYRAGGVISTATSHRETLEDLKRACAGQIVETGGTIKLRPGAARTVVATITDDELIDDAEIQVTPKRPRSQLVNAVFGSFSDPAQQYEMIALPPRLSPADEAADGGIRLEEHYALDLVTSGTQGQRILEAIRRRARHQRTVKVRLPTSFALAEAGDWIDWTSERYGWDATFEFARVQVGADLTVTADLQEVSTALYAWTTAYELDPLAPGTLPSGGPVVGAISSLAVTTTSITNGAITRPGLHATWTAVTDATIVAMRIQYRIQGDTTALEVAVVDPSQGSHTWVTGVQGSSGYEIRAIPVTRPERAVDWTSWKQTPASTAGQAVASAMTSVEVTSVPANTITPEMLSPQARRELELTTALATLQGSVADHVAQMRDIQQHIAETAVELHLRGADLSTGIRVERITRETATLQLAQQISTVAATLDAAKAGILVEETARVDGDSALATRITELVATMTAGDVTLAASIATEETARVDGDSANASAISTLSSTVGGHTATLTSHSSSIGGLSASWTMTFLGDYATGFATFGGGVKSFFGVSVDDFWVAKPAVDGGFATGGTPKPVFVIGEVDGADAVGINGALYVDGSIKARHLDVISLDAISGTFGALTAGTITSPDGKLFISSNSDAAEIRISS